MSEQSGDRVSRLPLRFCPECDYAGWIAAYYCPECDSAFFPNADEGSLLRPDGGQDLCEYCESREASMWSDQGKRQCAECAPLATDGGERDAKKAGQEQATLTTCGGGCQREQDPRITEAFRARLNGATVDEAIALLDGPDPTGLDLAAVTDGGRDE